MDRCWENTQQNSSLEKGILKNGNESEAVDTVCSFYFHLFHRYTNNFILTFLEIKEIGQLLKALIQCCILSSPVQAIVQAALFSPVFVRSTVTRSCFITR